MIAVPARYRALFLLSASPRDDMSAVLDNPRPRINHSMLLQHIGRPVCFVGRVEKVSPNGKTFTVADGESRTVTVELNEPHDGELNGVVEVVGMVSNKGVLMATTYSMLQEAKGVPFDLELYNEAVKIIRDFPQHYPFHVAASG
ncbi:replication protein A 14 kDa subunit [Synchiropus splendidus]|uniref:replication protein A 14 kDa subunit n=1 Tax=Synchiropus splendidus TaxID=270530 RepID=UPI00237E7273|nr:replication protein A 14 kDa subunit [Synchiropus splendidus]